MKRTILFILLFSSLLFSQGIYFSEPTSTHIDYIQQSGEGAVSWNFYHASYLYVYTYYARLTYPDGSKTDWTTSDNGNGEIGGWWVSKSGTYKIEGKAWVASLFNPGYKYWAYRSPFTFSVIDNYTPSAPQNLNVSTNSTSPVLTWDRNSEQDVDGNQAYSIYRNSSFLSYVSQTPAGTNPTFVDQDIYWEGFDWGSWGVEFTYSVKANDINNHSSPSSNEVTISVDPNNSIFLKRKGTMVDRDLFTYELFDNYPNPFNPTTLINYQIPKDEFVSLLVYNALGQEVGQLINQHQASGRYSVKFDASNLPSGVYIYKLQAGEFSSTKKMLLTK